MDKKTVKPKKRKSDANKSTPDKKKKKDNDEYTEVHFKVELKDPNTTFLALEKFTKEAAKYLSDGGYDIVAGYCRSSEECTEVVQLLEGGKRKPAELEAIFGTLEAILIRLADDLSKYRIVGQNIVKKVWGSYSGSIYTSLSSRNKASHIKTALKLLSAMTLLGEASAKAILAQIDFSNPNIQMLYNRRNKKDPQDVCTCMIHFVLGLLFTGSDTVIRQLMDAKDFSKGLISGLCYDNSETVQLVLNAILEKIIQNPVISKTQKVRVFNKDALQHLGSLYYWKGVQEWDKFDGHDKLDGTMEIEDDDSKAEERHLVSDSVHKVLMELCTSYKYGIIFFDKTVGTSQKNQNHILTSFITSLSQVLENSKIQELILTALVACPDQLQYYLPCLQSSLVPRVSQKWITAMEFVIKLYSSQPDNFGIVKIREITPQRKLVAMLLTTLLPPSQILNIITQGLKHKDLLVRHTVLNLVKLILKRTTQLLHCLSSEDCSLLSLYRREELMEVIDRVKEEISKALPDVPTFMLCWDKLISHMKDKGYNSHEDVPDVAPISESSHMVRQEQVLSLYQNNFPSSLTENPVNISKIMEGVRYLSQHHSQSEPEDYLPQLYLLKLLSGTDSRKLPWVKESQEGHSLMYLLLDMIYKVRQKPHLVKTTEHLICQLLVSTGLFEFNKEELSLWIRHYSQSVLDGCHDSLANFLSKIFTTFISNPYPYSDKVNDFVSEGMSLESPVKDVDALSIGTTDSNINALLDMDEDDVEEHNEYDKDDDAALNLIRFPFSPLVIVAFETLMKKTESSKEQEAFMSKLLLDLLHSQLNPLPLVSLLQSFTDVNIGGAVRSYIMSFSKEGKAGTSAKICDVKPLTGEASIVLAEVFITGKVYSQEKLFECLTSASLVIDNVPILVRQLLLYISQSLQSSINDKDSNKRIHTYFQCIEKILKVYIDKKNLETTETKRSTAIEDEEFRELEIELNTPKDIIENIFVIVLKHPAILKWFLFVNPSSDASLTLDKTDISINTQSTAVTQCICSLVNVLKTVDLDSHGPLFEGFVNKIQVLLCSIGLIKKHKKLTKVVKYVQEILPIVTRHLSVEKLLWLLETILKVPRTLLLEDKKLSTLSIVAVELLTKLLTVSKCLLLKIDMKCVECFFGLQIETRDEKLLACCDELLQKHPHLSYCIKNNIMDSLLRSDDNKSLRMLENIVLHNHLAAEHVKQRFQEGMYDDRLEQISSIVLFLARKTADRSDDSSKNWLNLAHKKYKVIADDVHSVSDECRGHVTQLIILLVKCGILDRVKVLQTQVKSVKSNGLQNEHQVNLLHFLSEDTDQRKTLLYLYITSVIDEYSNAGNKENLDENLIDGIMEKIVSVLQTSAADIDFDVKPLPKFIKTILKSRFSDKRTFMIISKLVENVCDWPEELPLTTLHQMTMSHSLFLPIMFNEKHQNVKGALCDLLLYLVEADSKCCVTQHYGVLLASYMVTLCDTDQTLLKLMYMYEKNECDVSEFRPYLWGPKAVEHQSVQKTIGPSLLKKASIDQVIENLDQTKLNMSILNFPLRRKLQPHTIQNSTDCKSLPEVYDPCFILPLFSHIVSPDQLIDCRKFIERGCLGYVIAALSCHDNTMRGAAYHVLDNFLHHVEGSRFPEKDQVLYLMCLVRDSIEKPNIKLPCIITVFLAKMAKLMLKAEQHMYQMMNTFLYLKPTLDVTNVPEFYKLFNSSTLEYKEERSWILSLLLDGLRETADYRTFEKRYTFKLLLSFFDTAISDNATQVLVLKIVNRACQERTVAMDLARNHGIVTWLINVIKSSGYNRSAVLTDILHDLWVSMAGKQPETSEGKARFLSPSLSREMLTACQMLLKSLSDETSCTSVITLLKTMSFVLDYLKFTSDQLEIQGYKFTPSVVTLSDVKQLFKLTRQFSADKIVSSQPTERKTDIANHENAEDQKGEEHQANIEEANINIESSPLLSYKSLSVFSTKLFLYWKPFIIKMSDSKSFQVTLTLSKDLCTIFLEISTWMIKEIKSCDDLDLVKQMLQWILIHLEHLLETGQKENFVTKSDLGLMADGLVQLYSIINNRYRISDWCKQGTSLESLVQHINDILIAVAKMGDQSWLSSNTSTEQSLETVSMELTKYFTKKNGD